MKNRGISALKLMAALLLTVFFFVSAQTTVQAAEEPQYFTIQINGGYIINNDNGEQGSVLAVAAGQNITIQFDQSSVGAYDVFQYWQCSGLILNELASSQAFAVLMPACDVTLSAYCVTDTAASESAAIQASIEQSIAESAAIQASIDQSIAESAAQAAYEQSVAESAAIQASIDQSVAESAAIEQSIQQSAAASQSAAESAAAEAAAAEAAAAESAAAESGRTIKVGDYQVRVHVSDVPVPSGFILASDSSTFSEPVEAFYSNDFKTFVYYAVNGNTYSYYMYDKISNNMFPYVTLADSEGNTLLVNTPESESELVGNVKKKITINLGTDESPLEIPAWKTADKNGDNKKVIYLTSQNGFSEFYVYGKSDGAVSLRTWTEYSSNLKGKETTAAESETGDVIASSENEDTEAATAADAAKPKTSIFKNSTLWLIIIGIIILLLIVAVIIVLRINRNQEETEEELDYEEAEERFKDYDSPYMQPGRETAKPFDADFENAFPDELDLSEEPAAKRNSRQTAAGRTSSVRTENSTERTSSVRQTAARQTSARQSGSKQTASADPGRQSDLDWIRSQRSPEGGAPSKKRVRDEFEKKTVKDEFKKKESSLMDNLDDDDFEVIDFRKK